MIAKKNEQLALAVTFVIFLQTLTAVNDYLQVIYHNWYMIICSLFSLLFALVARKSLYLSKYAYLLYSVVYLVFAFEDTLYGQNVILSYGIFDSHYLEIVYGCLFMLVILVIYDRMDSIKCGADGAMS